MKHTELQARWNQLVKQISQGQYSAKIELKDLKGQFKELGIETPTTDKNVFGAIISEPDYFTIEGKVFFEAPQEVLVIPNFGRRPKSEQQELLDDIYNNKLNQEQREHFDEWFSRRLESLQFTTNTAQHTAMSLAFEDKYTEMGL